MRKLINFMAFCLIGFVLISCGITESDEQKSYLNVTFGADFNNDLYSSSVSRGGSGNTEVLTYTAKVTAFASDYFWINSSRLEAGKDAVLLIPSIPADKNVNLSVEIIDSEKSVVYKGSSLFKVSGNETANLNMNLDYFGDSKIDLSVSNNSISYEIFAYYNDSCINNLEGSISFPIDEEITYRCLKSSDQTTEAGAGEITWYLNGVKLEGYDTATISINLAAQSSFIVSDLSINKLICRLANYSSDGLMNCAEEVSFDYFTNFNALEDDTSDLENIAFVNNTLYDLEKGICYTSDLFSDDSFYGSYITGGKVFACINENSEYVIYELLKNGSNEITYNTEAFSTSNDFSDLSYDPINEKYYYYYFDSSTNLYRICNSEGEVIRSPSLSTPFIVYKGFLYYTENDVVYITSADGSITDVSIDLNVLFTADDESSSNLAVNAFEGHKIGNNYYIYALVSEYNLISNVYEGDAGYQRGAVIRFKYDPESESGWEFDKDFGIKGWSNNVETGKTLISGSVVDYTLYTPKCESDEQFLYNPLLFCAIKEDYLVILDDGLFKQEDSDPGYFKNRDRIMYFDLTTGIFSKATTINYSVPTSSPGYPLGECFIDRSIDE